MRNNRTQKNANSPYKSVYHSLRNCTHKRIKKLTPIELNTNSEHTVRTSWKFTCRMAEGFRLENRPHHFQFQSLYIFQQRLLHALIVGMLAVIG